MQLDNPSEAVAVVNLNPKEQLASAYEHGDTDLLPEEDAFPIETKTEAQTEPASKPRNPDGTFAKPIEPIQAPPSKPTHSARLVQMAKDFGIPDEEIAESTPEQLDFAVYQAHRMQTKFNEERANERALLDS